MVAPSLNGPGLPSAGRRKGKKGKKEITRWVVSYLYQEASRIWETTRLFRLRLSFFLHLPPLLRPGQQLVPPKETPFHRIQRPRATGPARSKLPESPTRPPGPGYHQCALPTNRRPWRVEREGGWNVSHIVPSAPTCAPSSGLRAKSRNPIPPRLRRRLSLASQSGRAGSGGSCSSGM